ncbi:MAG: AAA family ATPase [Gammaproteobacteria bacterium]|nr:AAA family ATPase [Gammaproteobacteria bacterium]MCP5135812.1 AAA family ATPase [Gammaproteobacteria bacterium]
MKLVEFRVRNYRSIHDSGPVRLDRLLSIVGRNETGKTNLLTALASVNRVDGVQPLSEVDDFPRDRELSEFNENVRVVDTLWELSPAERNKLGELFPRAQHVKQVTIGRAYKPTRYVGFVELPELAIDQTLVEQLATRIQQSIATSARRKRDIPAEEVDAALAGFVAVLESDQTMPQRWAQAVLDEVEAFQESLDEIGLLLPKVAETRMNSLIDYAQSIEGDRDAQIQAITWIIEKMPTFVYMSDVPALDGHQNVPDLVNRVRAGRITEGDEHFLKLAQVAGFDPEMLNELLDGDYRKRHQMLNRASGVVTRRLQQLWSDRPVRVRFRIDGDYFDTLITEQGEVCDIEVNLNARSRGFQWFFSLYVNFAADTAAGGAGNAILLLDEPGLHLHALGQYDLVHFFQTELQNQVIFTTHSPFMVPVKQLELLRTVTFHRDIGTQVSTLLEGDDRTLFPVRAALGYELGRSLFPDEATVVVEEIVDQWYLSAMLERVRELDVIGAHVTVTPVGGAQRLLYVTALMAAENLDYVLLLNGTADMKPPTKLQEDAATHTVFLNGTLADERGVETLEDLLDPALFHELVLAAYGSELKRRKLDMPAPEEARVRAYEEAFEAMDLQFVRTRPAREFLKRVGSDPDTVFSKAVMERVTTLIDALDDALAS